MEYKDELKGFLHRYAWLLEVEQYVASNSAEVKTMYKEEHDDLLEFLNKFENNL